MAISRKKDNMYMDVAITISKYSKCKRKQVGCIIVKNESIIAIGYNGTPAGFDNCCEEGNVTKNVVLHAESNAISKCSKSTISSKDATMYLTLSPCFDCAKLIIQSGIKRVVYKEEYRETSGLDLLREANILINKYNEYT